MARLANQLTALEVERFTRLKVVDPAATPPLWADGKAATVRAFHDGMGLYLLVDGRRAVSGASGSASWAYRYSFDGKAKMLGLGPWPEIKLGEAREKAIDARRLKANGKDPLAISEARKVAGRAQAARAVTFKILAEDYIKRHTKGWANAKTGPQWRSSLEAYAYPFIGNMVVQDIDTTAVLRILQQPAKREGQPLWEENNETASRVRGRIETILDYAKAIDLRVGDNPAAWEGKLKHALPARSKVRNVIHYPALPAGRVGHFMAALRAREGVAARALEFAILTAARSGEVRGATWGEISLEEKIWTIPSQRMKAKRGHRVPLSEEALAVLRAAMPQQVDAANLVFPGMKPGVPLSDMTLAAVIKRMNDKKPVWIEEGTGMLVVPHGFRSTFSDWRGEKTAFPSELGEAALAHALGGKVLTSYQRGDLFERRRDLMQAWADFCAAPMRGSSRPPD